MKVDLSDQVAMVTGAARGIGQAIGDALAANGARVVYTDLEAPDAQAAHFDGCQAVELDVTDEAQIDQVIDAILAEHGRLDILVNNAAAYSVAHRVTVDQFPRDLWDRIVNVDLTGPYLVCRKVTAAAMIPQGRGRIINIASIAGLVPLRLQIAYCAAKAGLVNLTKAMAIELGPHGILVNGVAPGSTLTDATRALFYGEDGRFRDSAQQMLAHIPLGRPGTVEEVAHAVLFLAAPESSYINGHVLTVDGGWTAGYTRDF
jgi:3-oxoacyl-[acyl-carrier protein] reductase